MSFRAISINIVKLGGMLTYPVTVTICLLLMAGLALAGRWLKRRGGERTLRYVLAWGSLAAWIGYVGWNMLPARFSWENSLPLHLCDLASLVAPLALLLRWRLLRTLLYFWAFTYTTQAFITPRLWDGPDSFWFWLFWINHVQILGLAIYDVAVLGYRPRLVDVGVVTACSLVWMGIVMPLDYAYDWIYGFVGRHIPETGSVLDYLGDPPWRQVWMVLLSIAGFIVCWLPWPIVRMCQGTGKQPD